MMVRLKLNQLLVKQGTVRRFRFILIIQKWTRLDLCVGPKGTRVQAVVNELKGEKIDIVKWSDDPVVFVANSLSPSKVLDVMVNEADKATTVVVPDYQLSLAIGKRGQNARLAAKLTGWKIDIKSETDARELGIYPREETIRLFDEQVENDFDFEEELDD